MTNHTPGPWKVAGHGNGKQQLPILASDGTEISVLTHGHLTDAYLIAAAPDLLRALKYLIEMEDEPPMTFRFIACRSYRYDAARAAVAKAEGITL